MHILYEVVRLGDISGKTLHHSLEEALSKLEEEYPMELVDPNDWMDIKEPTMIRSTPDPEDDRILIWEILPSGHKKVIWHFSGWHWNVDEFGIPQGKLPKDDKDLYSLALELY